MRKVQFGIVNFICHIILLLAIADPRFLQTSLYMVIILNIIGCVYLYSSDHKKSNHLQNFYDR